MVAWTSKVNGGWLKRYWPLGAGGFAAPLAAGVLARWIPLHFAVAGSYFVAFASAFWLFQRTSARPGSFRRRLGNSIVTGLAGGLVAGLLAFMFPWT